MIPRSRDQIGHLICSQFQLIFLLRFRLGVYSILARIWFSSQSANIQWTWVSLVVGVGIAYTMVPGDFFFDQLLLSCFLHFFSDCFRTQKLVMIQIRKARCWRAFFVLFLFANLRYRVTLKFAIVTPFVLFGFVSSDWLQFSGFTSLFEFLYQGSFCYRVYTLF